MRISWQFARSSWPSSLDRASELIHMSEAFEGREQHTLLGSAMLLLAIALEQALTTHLMTLSAFYRASGDNATADKAQSLKNAAFKTRLFQAPELSHIYPARLNTRSDYVDYLTELIERRNSLMHIVESPVSFELDADDDELRKGLRISYDSAEETGSTSLTDGFLTVNVNPRDVARAGNPWRDVTPAEARRSLAAVEMYADRVLSDPAPCELLVPLNDPSSHA